MKNKVPLNFKEYPPHPALSHKIKCYWTFSGKNIMPGTAIPFLTSGGFEFVFNFGDPFQVLNAGGEKQQFANGCIIGTMTKVQWAIPKGENKIIGICFQPGMAKEIFPMDASSLKDQNTSIDACDHFINQHFFNSFNDGSQNILELFSSLDKYLLERLTNRRDERLLAGAIQMIRQNNGLIEIEKIAEKVSVSIRQLERKFKSCVGITPKQFCRLVRFKAIHHQIRTQPDKQRLVWQALDSGYYDQAHFNREFKAITGMSPGVYRDSDFDVEKIGIPQSKQKSAQAAA